MKTQVLLIWILTTCSDISSYVPPKRRYPTSLHGVKTQIMT